MPTLITLKGPNAGISFPCSANRTIIGRHTDCAVWLDSPAVSRHHAEITFQDKSYVLKDLGSSNGTFVNGERLTQARALKEEDTIQIGPYLLALRPEGTLQAPETGETQIRAQVNALGSNEILYARNPEQKLRVFLDITQNLGQTLEMKPLLKKLLEQLFGLFPQTDRGLVILTEGDHFVTGAIRTRPGFHSNEASTMGPIGDVAKLADEPQFSRTLVQRALDDQVGLLSEDVREDDDLPKTATMLALNLHSVVCVPLLGRDRSKLGVIQLDCITPGSSFKREDLELLTTLGLQLSSVLENVALHEQRIKEERLRQELAMARKIQQSFLPEGLPPCSEKNYELFARVLPAREVSGDLYDFFEQQDGRLAFFLGDVSGKGMPAALFMIAVRALTRHLAQEDFRSSEMLTRLNDALVADNPTALYVTLAHGKYNPQTGDVTLVAGGQLPPLLRRADGTVQIVEMDPCMVLGYDNFIKTPKETELVLQPGDTLILYSDGNTEARAPNREMFGVERLQEVLSRHCSLTLEECANEVSEELKRFTGQDDLQDDQTLLLLRHQPGCP